jgi:hypothetical protein
MRAFATAPKRETIFLDKSLAILGLEIPSTAGAVIILIFIFAATIHAMKGADPDSRLTGSLIW